VSSTPRVAVVTGAAQGIGRRVAETLAETGYALALTDIQESAATVATVREFDAEVLDVPGDVSSDTHVTEFGHRVREQFGRIDVLVNNAGISFIAPAEETTSEQWRRVLDVNLTGPFMLARTFGAMMLEAGGGSIVNVASISGLRASTLRVAYGSSKAALIHLTKQYAVELGNVGIRVNVIAPGPVETEMAKLVHSVAIRSDYYDAIPLSRYGTVEEMANAVGFLCSDEASFITGQVIAVDGGFDAAGVGLPTFRRRLAEGGLQPR